MPLRLHGQLTSTRRLSQTKKTLQRKRARRELTPLAQCWCPINCKDCGLCLRSLMCKIKHLNWARVTKGSLRAPKARSPMIPIELITTLITSWVAGHHHQIEGGRPIVPRCKAWLKNVSLRKEARMCKAWSRRFISIIHLLLLMIRSMKMSQGRLLLLKGRIETYVGREDPSMEVKPTGDFLEPRVKTWWSTMQQCTKWWPNLRKAIKMKATKSHPTRRAFTMMCTIWSCSKEHKSCKTMQRTMKRLKKISRLRTLSQGTTCSRALTRA